MITRVEIMIGRIPIAALRSLKGELFGWSWVCLGCGCTDWNPCEGGCAWVRPGLCTSCFESAAAAIAEAAWPHSGYATNIKL